MSREFKAVVTYYNKEDLLMAMESHNYYCALSEIQNLLRKKIKYEEHSPEVYEALEKMRTEVYGITQELMDL